MELAELRNQRVGVLMSGGLSCTAVGVWLADNGVDVISFVADIGQRAPFSPARLAEVLTRQGLKTQVIDLREQMAQTYLDLVRYQATYEGGYWNTTGASRATLVAGLAEPLRAAGCTMLAHGCVGGGNDQARFARYGAALAPELTVFSPWTHDWLLNRFPHRQAMSDYLTNLGFPIELARFVRYSIDGNLGGYSHESDDLEQLSTPSQVVEPILTRRPHEARDEAELMRIRFVEGRPVAINGVPASGLDCLRQATDSGGRNGVSLRSVVENRINGTKCRGVYEAPGLDLLGQSLAALYQVTLDKTSTDLMHTLSRHLGRAAYEGRLLETSTQAACAAADLLTAHATGSVGIELYKGNIIMKELAPDVDVPGTARQIRFRQGGHHWQLEPLTATIR